jgi:hypothetical protein
MLIGSTSFLFGYAVVAVRMRRPATAIEVIDTLDAAGREFGLPHAIRVDQGC